MWQFWAPIGPRAPPHCGVCGVSSYATAHPLLGTELKNTEVKLLSNTPYQTKKQSNIYFRLLRFNTTMTIIVWSFKWRTTLCDSRYKTPSLCSNPIPANTSTKTNNAKYHNNSQTVAIFFSPSKVPGFRREINLLKLVFSWTLCLVSTVHHSVAVLSCPLFRRKFRKNSVSAVRITLHTWKIPLRRCRFSCRCAVTAVP